MKTKEISKSEANNLEKKISCFDIRKKITKQKTLEKNFIKEYYKKYNEIKIKNSENKNRQKYARNQEMEKKDYIGLFETKEVRDENQEDIKNSPLQEMGLQEPNIDENTKKAKSKVKTLSKAWLDLHEVEKMEDVGERVVFAQAGRAEEGD